MKFDQGFVTWSPKSLTQGKANGQGTVASSTSNQRFNQNLLAVESLFVRENSAEPVPFVMYARGFERFVSLGISPGKNYPGFTTQNLLVHIFVPQTSEPWEAFAGCLAELPISGRLDEQDYMRTDLPVLEAGEDDSSLFDLAGILSEFGFEDKKRLADFLQRSVSIILERSSTLLIVLPDGNTSDLRRSAGRITWLLAMAMPKPAGNTMRYIWNLSYGVGTKDNASKANVIYAGCSAIDGLNAKHIIHLDRYMTEKEEEEILPVFCAVSDRIIEYGRKKESCYQLISELEDGRDPVWGDLQIISDTRYYSSKNLTVSTLNMGYIYWQLEDPARRGSVSYADIRDYYSGFLVQTKHGSKWHETMLFKYLRQETSPDYQSVLSLWKEVLSPALKRRDQFDKDVWDEYLDFVFWCMKHVYDISPKNHRVFLHQLKNDEDSAKVQHKLYNDPSDDNIIEKEIKAIKTVEDYQRFISDYRILCKKDSKLEQRALAPVSFEVYINPATSLERRIEISGENLPGFDRRVEDYIKSFFTAEKIPSFIRDEMKRTEKRYLEYAYTCLYDCLKGYLGQTPEFLNIMDYQDPFLDEQRTRNIKLSDPGISSLLKKEYERNLNSKLVDDLAMFPDENWIGHLNKNGIDWYTLWQNRVFEVLEWNPLASGQIQSICEACTANTLFSRLPNLESYKALFSMLRQAAGNCKTDSYYSGNKSETDALRMKIQISLMDVCRLRKWPLEITENDDDVWDWKYKNDFADFYSAWITLSGHDRIRILQFPEPQRFRCRISNQNLLKVYDYVRNNKSIKDELAKAGLEDRYFFYNCETGKTGVLYLEASACNLILQMAREQFQIEESEIKNVIYQHQRNMLMNLHWALSLFDTDAYWKDNDEYKWLKPDGRRIHFYEAFPMPSPTFNNFVRFYKQYYRNPEEGELYLRQGWRFSKFFEDYNRYWRNSNQIIKDVSSGVYDAGWLKIIRNIYQNLTAGSEDHMENADIYKKNQSAVSELKGALEQLQDSIRELSANIHTEKTDYNLCVAMAENLQNQLKQVQGKLKEKKGTIREEENQMEQKIAAGRAYAEACGSLLLVDTKPITTDLPRNINEEVNIPAGGQCDEYGNWVFNKSSVGSGRTAQEINRRMNFSDEAAMRGRML